VHANAVMYLQIGVHDDHVGSNITDPRSMLHRIHLIIEIFLYFDAIWWHGAMLHNQYRGEQR
jgi:hypothetical protein